MAGKLPLTKPIYMAELGRRMGLPTREARRALRRIEYSRKVRLLFDSRTERQGRLWTTESLLQKYCAELIDRPRRALHEAKVFKAALTEKIDDLKESLESVKTYSEQELSELRARLSRLERRGHT
jgi:chromosome segregation ATPase